MDNLSISTSIGEDAPFTGNSHFSDIDDGGFSQSKISSKPSTDLNQLINNSDSDYFSSLEHSAGIFKRNEIDLVNKRYRFGINTPYDAVHTTKEYLFFTKPDLNIYPRENGVITSETRMQEGLRSQPYWAALVDQHPEILFCLQDSLSKNGDHFNHLLENCVQSNLSIPGLSSEMIDTPNNLYGVGYQYHGSAEASDDSFDFSLEFKDIKGLPVYHFFRAYEDYQILKHHGIVEPDLDYIMNKILYDQYSIYKFLVDEDGETIVYYAQLYGVKSKSLPREVFDSTSYDNGISYSIDFNAAFFDDMKPEIISNFNHLTDNFRNNTSFYNLSIHNSVLDRADARPARCAWVETIRENGRFKAYKLRWKGDDQY